MKHIQLHDKSLLSDPIKSRTSNPDGLRVICTIRFAQQFDAIKVKREWLLFKVRMAVNVLLACVQLTYLASWLNTPSAANPHISPTIIFKLSCVDKQLMLHSKYDLICPHFYLEPLCACNFWIKARGRDDNQNWREDCWMQGEYCAAFFTSCVTGYETKACFLYF